MLYIINAYAILQEKILCQMFRGSTCGRVRGDRRQKERGRATVTGLNTAPGGHDNTTVGKRESGVNKDRAGKRNRNGGADGRRYDRRKGTYAARDEAVREYVSTIHKWLIPERVSAELALMNTPGKRGPRFLYPPSLIYFVHLLITELGQSVRNAMAHVELDLERLGFPVPDYTTVHKYCEKYFGSDLGHRIMEEASKMLEAAGVKEGFDPLQYIRSGVFAEYQPTQLTETCEADAERNRLAAMEAREMSGCMEVIVFKGARGGKPRKVAVDGSGEGVSGPGIYMEHMWKANVRRFIKHHPLYDVETKEVLAVVITMESPGDSRLLIPLVSAAVNAGVRIGTLYADSAYDTRDNHLAMDEMGIGFVPNLRERFGKKEDLAHRNAMMALEQEIGKKAAHRLSGYNARWLIEAFFSVLKKLYGDRVPNRNFGNMARRMWFRYTLYNIRQDIINRHLAALTARLDECLTEERRDRGRTELFNTVVIRIIASRHRAPSASSHP